MLLAHADWCAATRLGQVGCAGVGPGASFAFGFTWAWRFISITVGRTPMPSSIRAQASGIGEGIYVSYLFTWLWTADMIWWWVSSESYAARSAWIDRVLHSFMLFIVFNGMVVYESGLIRWVGLAMFAGLAVLWVAVRRTAQGACRMSAEQS